MTAPAIKKLGMGAVLFLGAGYGGALLYRAGSEDSKEILHQFSFYKHTSHFLSFLQGHVDNLSQTIFRAKNNKKPTSALTDNEEITKLQRLHLAELGELRRKIMHLEGEHARMMTENQSSLDEYMHNVETELFNKYENNLKEAITKEHDAILGRYATMATRAERLEARLELLNKVLCKKAAAENLALCIDYLYRILKSEELDMLVLRRACDEIARITSKSELECVPLSIRRCLDSSSYFSNVSSLLTEFVKIRDIACSYSDYEDHSESILKYITWHLQRVLSPWKTPNPNNAIMDIVQNNLEKGNIAQALRFANQATGWPRVILKDWIIKLRTFLEVEQGLGLSHHYLACVKLG